MKKLILSCAVAFLSLNVNAGQADVSQPSSDDSVAVTDSINAVRAERDRVNKKVWGRNKYFLIGYSSLETQVEGGFINKNKFGFHIVNGHTYMFPGKPICNLFKVGIDLRFADAEVSKLKNDGLFSDNWSGSGDSNGDSDSFLDDLGCWTITAGVGIGPVVTVTPFSFVNNSARFLKASLYFHYRPSAGVYFVSQDGETDASWAFCNMFDFGGRLTWKMIGVGIGGSWGNGKFKPLIDLTDEEDSNPGLTAEKYKRKFASTRIYVSFTF